MQPQSSNKLRSEEPHNRRLTGAETPPQNQPSPPEKKDFSEAFKSRTPQKQGHYTAEGYDLDPAEFEGVHVEVEQRQFDADGNRTSKPRILKIADKAWADWFKSREAIGYSINKVLHRPAGIPEFEADPWRGQKPEGY